VKKELIPNVTSKPVELNFSKDPVLGLPYVVKGNRDFLDYSLKKYIKAKVNGDYSNITFRDLAGVFSWCGILHQGLRIYSQDRLQYARRVVRDNLFVSQVNKGNFLTFARKFIIIYEKKQGKGLNWGFLDKNYQRQHILEQAVKDIKPQKALF